MKSLPLFLVLVFPLTAVGQFQKLSEEEKQILLALNVKALKAKEWAKYRDAAHDLAMTAKGRIPLEKEILSLSKKRLADPDDKDTATRWQTMMEQYWAQGCGKFMESQVKPADMKEEMIDQLISLFRAKWNRGGQTMVTYLGDIGPRAKKALPYLEKFQEEKLLQGELIDVIRAIKKIKGK